MTAIRHRSVSRRPTAGAPPRHTASPQYRFLPRPIGAERPRRRRALRRAAEPGAAARAALWALLATGVSSAAWQGVAPALQGRGADFAAHFTAARIAAEGGPLAAGYTDPAWFQQEIERAGCARQLAGLAPSPPAAALALLPAAGVEPEIARRGLLLVSLALAAVSVALLASLGELSWLVAAVLLSGAGSGLIADLAGGGLGLLRLATALVGIWLAERERPLAAGVALGALAPLDGFALLALLYYAWRREWRLVGAAAGAAGAVTAATLALVGGEPFAVYLSRVLPAWLSGAIGDPFAVGSQSWSSLYRRLLLPEPDSNPRPWLAAPHAFAAAQLATAATLAGLGALAALRVRLGDERRERLFALAWLALLSLLLSPRPAPHELLRLSFASAVFAGLLLGHGRPGAAVLLGAAHVGAGLSGYAELLPEPSGPRVLLAYPRLWLLLAIFLLALVAFRAAIEWRGLWKLAPLPAAALALGLAAAERRPPDDGARRLVPHVAEALRDGAPRLDGPSVGRRRLVVAGALPAERRWSILGEDRGEWLPAATRSFYAPALASDDTRLLAVTVRDGRREIWLSAAPGRAARFTAVGESPSWHPDGLRFAFTRSGRLHVHDLLTASELDLGRRGSQPVFSPTGEEIAYVASGRSGAGCALEILVLATGDVRTAHRTGGRIADPAWAADGRWLLFAAGGRGGEDVFAVGRGGGAVRRLTRHSGIDRAPIWDEARGRILFLSDRGRGLARPALWWVPIPPLRDAS